MTEIFAIGFVQPSSDYLCFGTQSVKGALYRIWCGPNRLGDCGVHTLRDNSAFVNPAGQLLLPGGVRPEWIPSAYYFNSIEPLFNVSLFLFTLSSIMSKRIHPRTHSMFLFLTLSDFRTYIYVQNPKTVATPVRKYMYPDGNQNMGASNGHFTVSGPLHHELCT